MRVVMFYHSLCSDWNHGNAHFLRGVASELVARGHSVTVCEPDDSWSAHNLIRERGKGALEDFKRSYPSLQSHRYDGGQQDPSSLVEGADLVIVHEWNKHDLVRKIGTARREGGRFQLLFHDTHHRSVTDPGAMAAYDLRDYDGVLAFGQVIRDIYLERGWASRAWTWHEAADTRLFRPLDEGAAQEGDLVWIGNWGDDERVQELQEFLLDPVQELGLKARIHGVRYPVDARERLAAAGIEYAGWLPNYRAPEVFSRFRATVHVPRRPYVAALAGIPTIRVFEALACGIPLVCAPWDDAEGLFSPGADFLTAQDGIEMRKHLRDVLNDTELADALARHGLDTILRRHTCRHRVDELMAVCAELEGDLPRQAALAR